MSVSSYDVSSYDVSGHDASDYEQMVVEIAEHQRSRHFGKYRGRVRDVEDPEGIGRIIAEVKDIYGDQDSPWAMPVVPFAGPDHGLVMLPEVGDRVWIEFEAGDIARPLWTGGWWERNQLPEPGAVETRAIITSRGHKLVLDDRDNKVQLIHAGGAELTMTDNDITLTVGAASIVLSSQGVNINDGAFQVR